MKLKLLSWNVRGANNLDKRKVIKAFIKSQKVDVVCIQETKIQNMDSNIVRSLGVGRFLDWGAASLRMQRELQGEFWCFGTRGAWSWLI